MTAVVSLNHIGYLHSNSDEAPARAESLSPLKPQRGRTEFYSYVP